MKEQFQKQLDGLLNHVPKKTVKNQIIANRKIVWAEAITYKSKQGNPEWFATKLSRVKTIPSALSLIEKDMGEEAFNVWIEQVIIKVVTTPQVPAEKETDKELTHA